MYYDPPYFLLIAGLFAGITCGRAFEVTLRQAVKTWADTRSTRILQQLQGFSLLCLPSALDLGSDSSRPVILPLRVWHFDLYHF